MRVLAFVLVAATAAASCSTAAPTPRPTTSAEKESSTLKRLAHDDLFEGSVLVARNGRVLLEGGFGLADRGLLTPDGPTTRFRIGSVSKQFTAMAILMLEKQGRLHVSDPLCVHLSGCPQLWSKVTIEELLNHTAGIENYPYDQPDLFDRIRQPITPVEQVAQVGERPLIHPPGTAWSYCNVCYAALGLVVEKEAGRTLAHFLKASVFDPLGMHDTGIDEGYRLPQHAVGYTRRAAVGPAAQQDLTSAYEPARCTRPCATSTAGTWACPGIDCSAGTSYQDSWRVPWRPDRATPSTRTGGHSTALVATSACHTAAQYLGLPARS